MICQSSYLVVPDRKLGFPQSDKCPTSAATGHLESAGHPPFGESRTPASDMYRRGILTADHTLHPPCGGRVRSADSPMKPGQAAVSRPGPNRGVISSYEVLSNNPYGDPFKRGVKGHLHPERPPSDKSITNKDERHWSRPTTGVAASARVALDTFTFRLLPKPRSPPMKWRISCSGERKLCRDAVKDLETEAQSPSCPGLDAVPKSGPYLPRGRRVSRAPPNL